MANLAQSTNPITTGTPGLYFYVNTITTPNDQNLQRLLNTVNNTGAFTNIFTGQSEYSWACTQVRKAGGNTGYACGSVIDAAFFDGDKMQFTINYVILLITPRVAGSMGTSAVVKSRGVTPVATHGFVVLRDLTRVTNGIFPAIAQRKNQSAYPGSEYFEQLFEPLKDEPMLYIEGLCANRAAGRGAALNMMDIVHRIALGTGVEANEIYKGCKLSALVYVIQFYFRKFSYRFRKGCEGSNSTSDKLRPLNNTVPRLPRLPDDNAAYEHNPWLEFLKLLSVSGFNAQTTQRQSARVLSLRDSPIEMYDEDGDIYAVTSRIVEALKKLGWEDQGYKMYFCFYNDPMYGVNTFAYSTPLTQQIIQAARGASGRHPARRAATGVSFLTQQVQGPATTQYVQGMLGKSKGGRKRQKKKGRRTKKRALKKRHRRTKRRKTKKAGYTSAEVMKATVALRHMSPLKKKMYLWKQKNVGGVLHDSIKEMLQNKKYKEMTAKAMEHSKTNELKNQKAGKRKRKTYRKKSGGKHKLSQHKCTTLKHQHSKLAQSLDLVGRALQTQCKKRL